MPGIRKAITVGVVGDCVDRSPMRIQSMARRESQGDAVVAGWGPADVKAFEEVQIQTAWAMDLLSQRSPA